MTPFDFTVIGTVRRAPDLLVRTNEIVWRTFPTVGAAQTVPSAEVSPGNFVHDLSKIDADHIAETPTLRYEMFNLGLSPLVITSITATDSRALLNPRGPLTVAPGDAHFLDVDIAGFEREAVAIGKE